MNPETAIIPRQTLALMAETWETVSKEVTEAMRLLDFARERLRATFQPDGYRFRFCVELNSRRYDQAGDLLKEVQKDVWSCLIDRMELRKLMSLKAQEELDKQLKTGEGMPDITLPNLLAMLEGTMARVPQLIEELVKEVYDWLRPVCWRHEEYATNKQNEWVLGTKVIKGGCVEPAYGGHWRVSYYRQGHLTALDNVFHALDGKGLPKTHHGPLTDAICALPASKTTGETDYFRFRCFRNHNLHLEFKRQDLVHRFNLVAGGMRLGNVKNG